jgi:hypothetical protein
MNPPYFVGQRASLLVEDSRHYLRVLCAALVYGACLRRCRNGC